MKQGAPGGYSPGDVRRGERGERKREGDNMNEKNEVNEWWDG